MFNALKYNHELEEVGFTRQQADLMTNIWVEFMNQGVSTKQDIIDLKVSTKQDIQDLRVATKQDIQDLRVATKQDIMDLKKDIINLENKFDFKMNQLKSDLTIRLGLMMTSSIAILGTLLTVLHKLI